MQRSANVHPYRILSLLHAFHDSPIPVNVRVIYYALAFLLREADRGGEPFAGDLFPINHLMPKRAPELNPSRSMQYAVFLKLWRATAHADNRANLPRADVLFANGRLASLFHRTTRKILVDGGLHSLGERLFYAAICGMLRPDDQWMESSTDSSLLFEPAKLSLLNYDRDGKDVGLGKMLMQMSALGSQVRCRQHLVKELGLYMDDDDNFHSCNGRKLEALTSAEAAKFDLVTDKTPEEIAAGDADVKPSEQPDSLASLLTCAVCRHDYRNQAGSSAH